MASVKETHGLCCPQCGNDHRLDISFLGTCTLTPDGSEDSGDHEWDDTSQIVCHYCGHNGLVRDFQVKDEPKPRKSYKCPECGSRQLSYDANAKWSDEDQDHVISSLLNVIVCDECDTEIAHPVEIQIDAEGKEIEP